MQISAQAMRLNQQPLSGFKSLFGSLTIPEINSLEGFYQAEFTGPEWLRRLAGPTLALGGLGGWQGKEFGASQMGVNLVFRQGGLQRRFPFTFLTTASALDGGPSIAVHYTQECPFPWLWIVDELRSLDDCCLLGMTYIHKGLLKKLAFPFLLHTSERANNGL